MTAGKPAEGWCWDGPPAPSGKLRTGGMAFEKVEDVVVVVRTAGGGRDRDPGAIAASTDVLAKPQFE